MIVTEAVMGDVFSDIKNTEIKGFDTETYGVRFTDRIFSLIISTPKDTYYFNFNANMDHLGKKPAKETILPMQETLKKLRPLFFEGVWAAHNLAFDIQKLRLEVPDLMPFRPHCTLSAERLLRNDFMDYSLDTVAKRYGFEKSKAVEEYINKHGLFTSVRIPGKKRVEKVKRFDLVPLEIMVEYGCKDAYIHRRIAELQRTVLGLYERDETHPYNNKDARERNTARH